MLNSSRLRAIAAVLSVGAILAVGSSSLRAQDEAPKVTFDDHIKPIFRQQCVACHDTGSKLGGLDLTTYAATMEGGSSGGVIEPGSAGDSRLYQLVIHQAEPFMPQGSDKMVDAELEVIRNWIDGGVLENAGSKPNLRTKPKMELAAAEPGTRPEVVAWPGMLPLEPSVLTSRATAVTAIATSPWAPLAAIGAEEQILLYDTRTLQLVGVLPFAQGIPRVVKFSRDGSLLLAGGGRDAERGIVAVWDVKTGEQIIEVGDELDTVLAADISADHQWIALGGPEKMIRIYSTQDGALKHEIKKHTDWVTEISFSPDGVLLATGDRNGGLHVWETFTARPFGELRGHGAMISGLSWRGDSNIVASCSEDGTLRVWEMNGGSQVRQWNAHGGGVADVEFLRDGRILSCGRDRVAKLWDQAGAQQKQFDGMGDLALAATFCDETGRVIAGDWSGQVRVWNGEDAAQLGALSANPPSIESQLAGARENFAPLKADEEAKRAAMEAAKAAYKQAHAAHQESAAAMNDSLSRVQRWEQAMAFQQQWNTLTTQIAQAEATAEAEAARAGEAQAAVTAAETELAEVTKREEALDQQATSAEAKLAEQANIVQTANTEIVAATTNIEESTARAAELEQTIRDLNGALDGMKKAAADKDADDLSGIINQLEQAIAARAEQLQQAAHNEAELQQKIGIAREQLKSAEAAIATADSEKSAAAEQIAALPDALATAENKLATAKTALEGAMARLQHAEDALTAAKAQLAALQSGKSPNGAAQGVANGG